MADLNKSVSDNITTHEDVGQNLIINADFENAPAFVAATTTQGRWIDGSAAGSTTNDIYSWYTNAVPANASIQFDNSTAHGGTYSILLNKTSGVGATVEATVASSTNLASVTLVNQFRYGIYIYPSTAYKLTCYYKQTTKAAGTNRLDLNQYDGINATRLSNTNISVDATTVDKDWTAFTTSFTSHASASFCVIGVAVTSFTTGSVWFDDVVLMPISRLTGVDVPITPLVTPGVQNISAPKIWS